MQSRQGRLIESHGAPLLVDFIDMRHPRVLLADRLDWESFEPHWNARFSNTSAPKAASARLAAGLLMLKHREKLSDERLIEAWTQNPYMQYFCGETHFQHEPPINPITLGRWRRQLGEEGLEYLLTSVLSSALKMEALKPEDFSHG